MINIQPVSIKTFAAVTQLKISAAQEEYIPDNTFLLAMSKVLPNCTPLAIFHDGEIVGFALYGLDEDRTKYWIHIMMIDARHQGKGYAKEAFEKVLAIIQRDKTVHKIVLAVNKGNASAVQIYEKRGFVFTNIRLEEIKWAVKIYGGLLNEEYIMELCY